MGISTYALEGARLGIDWRELFEQCARERALMDKYGLTFDMTTTKPTGASATAADPEADAGSKPTEAAAA
jgi:capsid protein